MQLTSFCNEKVPLCSHEVWPIKSKSLANFHKTRTKKKKMQRTWNWASSGSPARISSVTKWTPRCWGRRCNWKKEAIRMKKVEVWTIYHLSLQPSIRSNGQTRAAGVRGEQGCLQAKSILGDMRRKRNLWGKANIRRIRRSQTFYRTACLSEGGWHWSGSVSRRGSRLCRGGTGGFCTFRRVPVWRRRVVAVPVEQNWDAFKKIERWKKYSFFNEN